MEPGAFRVLVRSFQSVAWASWSYHSGCTLRALQLAGSRSGGAAWTRVAQPGFAAPSRWPGTSCPPPPGLCCSGHVWARRTTKERRRLCTLQRRTCSASGMPCRRPNQPAACHSHLNVTIRLRFMPDHKRATRTDRTAEHSTLIRKKGAENRLTFSHNSIHY